ncbi:MAG: hypothetical protein KF866_12610 [Phycisphaeraceae bacterium]|nr:hypothetical protein [Phycisphaeraceae bacterium]MCW5754098.1 hypothetical protein [Phycisphaeraceae bacterium]
MALFGKKKDVQGETGGDRGDVESEVTFSPEKAKAFFDRAKTVHEATNYEYAMTLWLNGMRLDPTNLAAIEGYWKSAVAFENEPGSKLSKDTRKAFSGRGEIEKFLSAMLEWGVMPVEPSHPVAAAQALAKVAAGSGLDFKPVARWLCERALGVVANQKKPRKDHYIKLMEASAALGIFEIAVRAGDAASRLDPGDTDLSTRTRNMAAQATMSTGGYDRTGEEGGFRSNIRDAEKQRRLDTGDRVVKTEDVKDQQVLDWERDYAGKPDDIPTINGYVRALLERGRPEDEKQAYTVLMKAYETTRQFTFRKKAGEIKMRQARRKLEEYLARAEANPQDEVAQSQAKQAERKYLEWELDEYRLQVANYPTDLSLKFELGVREYKLGNSEEAIALFQEAQHDPRNRTPSLMYLGLAFARMGWMDESVDTLRKAVEQHADVNDAMGMDLRYALMTILEKKAAQSRSLDDAQEAERLASSIAIQQISFKDIRERRDALKKLVAELRQAS